MSTSLPTAARAELYSAYSRLMAGRYLAEEILKAGKETGESDLKQRAQKRLQDTNAAYSKAVSELCLRYDLPPSVIPEEMRPVR